MENNIELNKMSREPLENYAVCVRHAFKHYGSKHPLQVLQDFNMTVPKGIIYGLLGASGCGKTTLLNCMIGRSSLDSGVIKVLGAEEPPGPRIGFMPQNIALYNEFSIEESMTYFGWIAGMSTEEIKERLNFLGALLHLPEVDKKIKNLSGGQQRRVSLATALLHEPELLILDEPTVGLDPLLRETIWEHLLQITSKRGATVILTTHYIDETRDAHQIGLMRGGRLLAEESPEDLLFYLNTSSLEEVFFILSAQQSENGLLPTFEKHRSFGKPYSDLDFIDSEDENPKNDHKQEKTKLSTKRRKASGTNHMKALIWKNFLWMLKNYPMMISMILLPTLTVLAFCICFGHKPRGLDVAVWNLETNNTKCTNLTCDSPLLSCQYLDYVERARLINLHYSGSLEEAQKSVLHGKTHAALWVSQNYTAALKKRIHKGYRTKTWDILHSTVNVYKDNAVKDVGEFIKGHLYERFQAFLGDYFEACEGSRRLVDLPIKWEEPIYGDPKLDFTEFGSSGVILSLVFFSAAALSGTSMMIERNEGILERSLVMGMSPIKILLAHFACEIGVMGLQCISILLVGFGFYGLTLKGSIFLVLFLTFLTGLGGMCAGFVISCAFSSEAAATHVLLGSFMPLIFISGLVWPLEGMHPILQVMAIGIPFTQISESMRSILHRGWGIDKPIVYLGFLSISGWSLIFLAISIVCLKYRKN